MHNIENNIDIFIPQQIPLFYNEYGTEFVEFLRQYYKWLQSAGKPINVARELLEYGDIDTTVDPYLQKIEGKYLANIPTTSALSRKKLLKNALELYRNKGNERSYDILFRALYNEDVLIYTPGQDMLRLSDGEWIEPAYLEVSYVSDISQYVNKEIVGIGSGAKAIVENYQQIIVNNKTIDILILSNVRGFFRRGEFIKLYGSLQINNLPKILGSLSGLSVVDGGANFNVGDILSVSGEGKQGKARVVNTITLDGKVDFKLVGPGSGYNINTIPIVQTRVRLDLAAANNNIRPGQLLYQNDNIANGTVFSISNSDVVVKEITAGFQTGSSFKTAITFTMSKLANTANSFQTGEVIRQFNQSNVQIANGTISTISAANTTFVITDVLGEFVISQFSNTGNAVFHVTSSNSNVNGFIHSITGGGNTGSGTIVDVTGGGSGASFRIGDLFDIEQILICSDNIRDYLNKGITFFNESSPATGNVSVTANTANVVGTSTTFTTTYTSNSYLQVDIGGSKEVRRIQSITNNTFLTTETVFDSTHTNVNHFTDGTNYGFPALSSATDIENLNTIIGSALTFELQEVGSIAYLRAINPGTGYRLQPFVTMTYAPVAALAIQDFVYGGIKGNNAIITATAGIANGIVTAVAVVDSGYGFEPGEFVTMEKEGSPFGVTGRALVINQGKGQGRWKNTRGFLSSDKFIQDSRYYQEYSYEIQTNLNQSKYHDVVKKILHPIGTEMFGKVLITEQLTSDDSVIVATELELPANGTVTANITSNVIIGTSTSFNTLFSNGDLIKIDQYTRIVTNVANNTSLQIDIPFSGSFVSNTFSKIITG